MENPSLYMIFQNHDFPKALFAMRSRMETSPYTEELTKAVVNWLNNTDGTSEWEQVICNVKLSVKVEGIMVWL